MPKLAPLRVPGGGRRCHRMITGADGRQGGRVWAAHRARTARAVACAPHWRYPMPIAGPRYRSANAWRGWPYVVGGV